MARRLVCYMRDGALMLSVLGAALPTLGQAQSAAVQILLDRARTLERTGHPDLAAQTYRQVLLADPHNPEAIAGAGQAGKPGGHEQDAQVGVHREPKAAAKISVAAESRSPAAAPQKPAAESKPFSQASGPAVLQSAPAASGNAPAVLQSAAANTRMTLPTAESAAPGNAPASVAAPQPSRSAAEAEPVPVHAKDTPHAPRPVPAVPQTPEERAAYAALDAGRVTEAENRFQDIIAQQPSDARALAGLGLLRMQQKDYAAAISYLTAAHQYGNTSATVLQGLENAQFFSLMQQGTQAYDSNQFDQAQARFRQAAELRPASAEALQALAGTVLKMRQSAAAAELYEQLLRMQPNSAEGWRGLLAAQNQGGNNAAALATLKRTPSAVRTALARDPEYLGELASVYVSSGQPGEAQQVLVQALNLPFAPNASGVRTALQVQYAGLLAATGQGKEAQAMFQQVLSADANNVGAWQGLVVAYHASGADAQALATVGRMPPAVYQAAQTDPSFLVQLAAVNQGQGKVEAAQHLLERAAALESTGGRAPNVATQLALAAVYIRQKDPARAYSIYRGVLTASPERLDAWKGLLETLHVSGHDAEALAQLQQIPAGMRQQLSADPEYLTNIAAVYAAMGDNRAALTMLEQAEARYHGLNQPTPVQVAIEHTWLLYNQADEAGLYAKLTELGARADLTQPQRSAVETIWGAWSVRRAQQAIAAGNARLATNILNAAARSFPGNAEVLRELAGGYAANNDAKTALKLYKKAELNNASSSDYQGAIGAALAANDRKQAESWVRAALQAYPRDAKVLTLAAKFEQARGNQARAREYYQAALTVMTPPGASRPVVQPVAAVAVPRPKPPQEDQMDLSTLLAPRNAAAFIAQGSADAGAQLAARSTVAAPMAAAPAVAIAPNRAASASSRVDAPPSARGASAALAYESPSPTCAAGASKCDGQANPYEGVSTATDELPYVVPDESTAPAPASSVATPPAHHAPAHAAGQHAPSGRSTP